MSKRDEWLCGYAAALANILRRPDQSDGDLVTHTMRSDGITIAHLEAGGVDSYDLEPLRRAEVRNAKPLRRRSAG